jgi:hypothetical protein
VNKIAEIVAHHIDNSPAGGTLPLSDYPLPNHGYFVGGAGPVLVFPSERVMRDNWPTVKAYAYGVRLSDHQFIGWWTDPETGKVYLDCSTWHGDMFTADQQAMRRGEIAFYDVEHACDIKTGSTGIGEAA